MLIANVIQYISIFLNITDTVNLSKVNKYFRIAIVTDNNFIKLKLIYQSQGWLDKSNNLLLLNRYFFYKVAQSNNFWTESWLNCKKFYQDIVNSNLFSHNIYYNKLYCESYYAQYYVKTKINKYTITLPNLITLIKNNNYIHLFNMHRFNLNYLLLCDTTDLHENLKFLYRDAFTDVLRFEYKDSQVSINYGYDDYIITCTTDRFHIDKSGKRSLLSWFMRHLNMSETPAWYLTKLIMAFLF